MKTLIPETTWNFNDALYVQELIEIILGKIDNESHNNITSHLVLSKIKDILETENIKSELLKVTKTFSDEGRSEELYVGWVLDCAGEYWSVFGPDALSKIKAFQGQEEDDELSLSKNFTPEIPKYKENLVREFNNNLEPIPNDFLQRHHINTDHLLLVRARTRRDEFDLGWAVSEIPQYCYNDEFVSEINAMEGGSLTIDVELLNKQSTNTKEEWMECLSAFQANTQKYKKDKKNTDSIKNKHFIYIEKTVNNLQKEIETLFEEGEPQHAFLNLKNNTKQHFSLNTEKQQRLFLHLISMQLFIEKHLSKMPARSVNLNLTFEPINLESSLQIKKGVLKMEEGVSYALDMGPWLLENPKIKNITKKIQETYIKQNLNTSVKKALKKRF